MDETTGKNRNISTIVLSLLFVGLSAFFGYISIKMNQKIQIAQETMNGLLNKEQVISSDYSTMDDRIAEMEKTINDHLNLNELIAEKKNEYYQKVRQLEEMVVNDQTDIKIAYLTFDDGPYLKTTHGFLDCLKENDVLATFFIIGWKSDERYDDIFARYLKEGHTLANHTYSHTIHNSIYKNVASFMDEIEECENAIYRQTGYRTNVMRFPGGSSQARGLKDPIVEQLRAKGYGYVNWDCTTEDGKYVLPAREFRDNVLNNTNNKKLLVVLMHDYSENTLVALPEIIQGLKDQGYILCPLFNGSLALNY